MTQLTKRKLISGGLRASSVLVAGAVPIWLIAQKFPLWATEQPAGVTLTGAGIVAAIVAVLVLWKKILLAVKPMWKKMKNMRGVVIGTVLVSGAVLLVSFLIKQIYPILPDIETICMGGVISGLGGVGLDVAASYVMPKEKEVKAEEEKAEEAKEA